MAELKDATLCILGCGNLGRAILKNLVTENPDEPGALPFSHFIACVRSDRSQQVLEKQFSESLSKVTISKGDNVNVVQKADVVVLGADPADVETVLTQPGISEALSNKLLISVAAGWPRQKLESTLYGSESTKETIDQEGRAWVVRTLPNVAAQVSQSLTAIESSNPPLPEHHLSLTTALFEKIGKVVHIEPRLMDATTAVGGSTPAFWAVICDAFIDAAVAVGVPRGSAQTMIYQSMRGTAEMLQSGIHPGILKDEGTSPEGCTIGGLMVLEEGSVRGHLGRALREAVTIARLMGTVPHPNDTRQ